MDKFPDDFSKRLPGTLPEPETLNLLVQLNRYWEPETCGERKDDLRESYPQWFVYALLNLEDEILLRGLEFVTPISINRD